MKDCKQLICLLLFSVFFLVSIPVSASLLPLKNGCYKIGTNCYSDKILTVHGGSVKNGANIEICTVYRSHEGNDYDQMFKVKFVEESNGCAWYSIISAKSGSETKIETIRIGADDYIIKPFNLDEVLVRIEAVLRRSADGAYASSDSEQGGGVLSFGDLEYSEANNMVTFKGSPVKLTAKEMMLLAILLKNPQKTFTKANLYESVWNDTYIYEDNTINVHMSNLRSKLKNATGQDYIETVWGIGYKLKQEQ